MLDQSAVPVREQCGLGQITGFAVSDAADTASDQVNPSNISLNHIPAGWFLALAKKYPQAVKNAAMGAQNNPSILEPEHKWADAAQAFGWNVGEFQEPPLTVTDWTPYVQQLQSQGAEAVWPADSSTIAPYFQAMSTLGYNPAFIALSTQDYNSDTTKALQGVHTPPVYVETSWWPLELANQNASTEQLIQVMHKYAKGDTIDFDDEEGAESWLLWAKAGIGLWHQLDVLLRADQCRRAEELERGWDRSPGGTADCVRQEPHALAVFRHAPGNAEQVRL